MTYCNWYALNYPALADRAVLVKEHFDDQGVIVDTDVMAGPTAKWEIEGDAEMKNRRAIGLGTHISCLSTKQRLRDHVASKTRKQPESVRRGSHVQAISS